MPPKEIFHEFFWLFEKRGAEGFAFEPYERMMHLCGTYDKSVGRFTGTGRAFDGYDEFLAWLGSPERGERP